MRTSCLVLLLWAGFSLGCATPVPIPPEVAAKERAREEVNRLNARVIQAYRERQEAAVRIHQLQARLRSPGLSAKERANLEIDLDEATRQVTEANERAATLETELREEWAAFRAQYGQSVQSDPSPAITPRPKKES